MRVPTWERCDTWLGTPGFVDWPSGILDLLIPFALGTAVGIVGWWLLGFTHRTPIGNAHPAKQHRLARRPQRPPSAVAMSGPWCWEAPSSVLLLGR